MECFSVGQSSIIPNEDDRKNSKSLRTRGTL